MYEMMEGEERTKENDGVTYRPLRGPVIRGPCYHDKVPALDAWANASREV